VLGGADPRDSTSVPQPVPDYAAALNGNIKGLKLGLPKEYMIGGLDPQVKSAVDAAVKQLQTLGAEIVEISLPHTDYAVATYYIIATAEASSNLARFDGVRYGLRVEPPGADLATMYGATRNAGFGPEVKRRILLGTYVLSAGYYDAYYRKAQKVRTLIRRDFEAAFAEVDVLVTPTSPTPAFALGDRIDDPLAMYLSDVFTLPASLAGIAGMAVPCAPAPARPGRPELPTGLQLLGPAFGEEKILRVAAAWEAMAPARGQLREQMAPASGKHS
jgi:aspartyl-tRNA(Asn)/glutamyl-tRNA(Gln) amidotransferase subunit A